MELRAFAERVLFATSLEDKLQCPEIITDEQPGPALLTPEAPGRPAHLHFKPHGSGKADFPGLHRLEEERERGRLLHFFANHELLATELMALVLLRFPDAPAAFRKGVLQTLKDEQEHTRLYLERIKACGLEFGDLPVSGYFWRCVAPMENPIDYVAGLCLTFEQANLDFARHFAASFGKIGDDATARLLERIYRDEIAHVAYGLKWFRRWKNPSESDWEAFCRTLKFPLSPQRAKGFALNVAGRRAAGLDAHFIAELNVYSQSKGRTPSVFYFNPFAEGRIAEGKSFNPTKHQAQLARDLENLPQFLCRQDDIVLVERKPSVEFLSGIKEAGFPLPEFVEWGAGLRPGAFQGRSDRAGSETGAPAMLAILGQRKLGRLRPWAWGPDSVKRLGALFNNITAEQRTPEQRFNARIAQLYSKAWSAAFSRKFLQGRVGSPQPAAGEGCKGGDPLRQAWLCTENEAGVAADSLPEALAAIAAIRARGHHAVVVKEAVGLAGNNAVRLFEPELLATHRRWMERALEQRRQLVIEPWLDRVVDFSVQLEMTSAGLKLCGYTGLLNDAKGQYRGNWAESHHHTRIPTKVVTQFTEPPNISNLVLQLYAEIFTALETELRAADFLGPLGIDAFVYRDAAGVMRLKPIVEINPRYTMGRLMVELMRQTGQGSCGWFRLLNRASLRKEGVADFAAYARQLVERFPIRMEGEMAPRLREGAVCLNDPTTAQATLAVFQVHRSLAEIFPPPLARKCAGLTAQPPPRQIASLTTIAGPQALMKPLLQFTGLTLSLAWSLGALRLSAAETPVCRIEVVEKSSGWPVPLVELRTTHLQRFFTDNAGVIAFDSPELMGHETWFDVHGNGYEVPKDGFGYRGVRLKPEPGKTLRAQVNRTIIAKRLGRITGGGLFSESQKLGLDLDWPESGVVGCDSVQNAVHRGKMFWLWGDTTLAKYPLGIFDGTSATTAIQPLAKFEPPLRLKFDYFTDAIGAPRGIAKMPGSGPTWVTAYVSLPDKDGKPRLVGSYVKIKPPLEAYEWGLCVWNDATANFEQLRVLWTKSDATPKAPPVPEGHPAFWKDSTGKEWVLFGNPLPTLRCPATFEEWQDATKWEVLKPPQSLSAAADGKPVKLHSGSMAWNPWRKRWVIVFMEKLGKPSAFGELWYAESGSPTGPWGKAVKILSHENYTFYNPRIHPEFTPADSPVLIFEGTYTLQFADKPHPTPRYDYNQILYRLDLDDPALKQAQAN